jgi:hypothetical protein
MLKRLLAYFYSARQPDAPYHHPVLGSFEVVPDIGWGKTVQIDGRTVKLHLGSNGELPKQEMLDCMQYWIDNWTSRRTEINSYINKECKEWLLYATAPSADQLLLSSIDVLWPDHPWSCIMYLDLPGDEYRLFHISFDGHSPTGFAFDD